MIVSEMRFLPLVLSLLAATVSFAGGLQQGFFRIWKEGGEKYRIPVTAERMSDGAYRYRLPTKDIPRKAMWIDVVPDAADVSKGLDGQVRRYTTLPGGPVYHSCYEVICNKYFDKDLADMKDLGLNGLVHVDVMSARHPERCHDPRHPNNAAQECAWLRKIAGKARAAFGGYSSECGCDHFASDLDNILYQASFPGWGVPETSLVDGYLPTWSIVYNGIIMSTPFYATLDAGVPREAGGKSDSPAGREMNPVCRRSTVASCWKTTFSKTSMAESGPPWG